MTQIRLKMDFIRRDIFLKRKKYIVLLLAVPTEQSAALTTNREWNTKLVSTSQGEVAEDILKEFDELWTSEYALDYDVFYEEYKQRYEIIKDKEKLQQSEMSPLLKDTN